MPMLQTDDNCPGSSNHAHGDCGDRRRNVKKLAVTGSRHWTDADLLNRTLDAIHALHAVPTLRQRRARKGESEVTNLVRKELFAQHFELCLFDDGHSDTLHATLSTSGVPTLDGRLPRGMFWDGSDQIVRWLSEL